MVSRKKDRKFLTIFHSRRARDDPEADVRGAIDAGIMAVLICRSGDMSEKTDGGALPDYAVNSLLVLEELLASERK